MAHSYADGDSGVSVRLINQLLLVTLIMTAQSTMAAERPAGAPCAAAVHHEFDFWVGDWSVTEHGKPAGSNRIERLLEGCALLENWTGAGGARGHSLNFYDAERHLWQQTWIDSSGSALNLEGHFTDGRMILTSLKPGVKIADRIIWTPNQDGTVRQLWEHTDDAGKTWKPAFDGLYTRR